MNWRNMISQFYIIKKAFIITNATFEWFLFILNWCNVYIYVTCLCKTSVTNITFVFFTSWTPSLCFFKLKYLVNLVSQRWHAWVQKGYKIAQRTSSWGAKIVCTVVIDHIQTRSLFLKRNLHSNKVLLY